MAKTYEERALKTLRKLERQIDGIAATPVRHSLSEHIISMRRIIWIAQREHALATRNFRVQGEKR